MDSWSRQGTAPAWLNRIGRERLVASSDDASMARTQRGDGVHILPTLHILLFSRQRGPSPDLSRRFLSPASIPYLPPRGAWRLLNPPLYLSQPIGYLS